MEATLRHSVEYNFDGRSSVSAVAESLLANERLIKEAALLLEAFVPGLIIESTTISVGRVVQESPLKELFVVALVAAYQTKLERDVPAIVQDLTGVAVPEQYHSLLTVLVMIIAVYGISKVMDLLFPSRQKDELDKSYRSLTVVAGDLIQTAPEQIDTAVRARFIGKRSNQVSALVRGFFAPARGHANAKILGQGGVEIDAPALSEIPQLAIPEAETPSGETETQFEYNKRIAIHAMDRDRGKAGWAAHIPSLFNDRVPMRLDKTIDPESLFTKRYVTGDVLIVYNVDEDGEQTPSEIHLLRIKSPAKRRKKAG